MRRWINLFENQITAQDFEHFIAHPTIEHGVDFVLEDLAEYGLDEMLKMANDFKDAHGPVVKVFRGLWVYDPRDAEFLRLNRVGASWSPDLHHAINEHGPDGGFDRHHRGCGKFTNLVLCGSVPHDAVDWIASFAIAVQDGDEPELRLKEGTVVDIHQLVVFDQSAHDTESGELTIDDAEVIPTDLKATV